MEASLFLKIKVALFLKFAPFFITMIGDAEAAKAMYADGKKDYEKAYAAKYTAIVRFILQKAKDKESMYYALLRAVFENFGKAFLPMTLFAFPELRKEISSIFGKGECKDRISVGVDMVNRIEEGFTNALFATQENILSFCKNTPDEFLLNISKVDSYLNLKKKVCEALGEMVKNESATIDEESSLVKMVDSSIAEIESGNRSLDRGILIGANVSIFFAYHIAPFLPSVVIESYRNKFFFFRLWVISLMQKRHK